MIETWTLVRFLHIVAIVFFVGGQLLLVAAVGQSQVLRAKLLVLVLVGVLTGLHIAIPRSRAVSYAVAVASLAVLWLGMKLTYG